MNCNKSFMDNWNGCHNTNRMLSCGFNAGFAKFTCLPKRETAVESSVKHVYPLMCPPVKIITIARVDKIAGVDNAVFLVGDVEGGFRQGKNYTIELPGESIGVCSGNFPAYLLLKNGNDFTLGFSTANIEAILRQNKHLFDKNGIVNADISLFPDLAPQDLSVAGADGHGEHCEHEREFKFRIVKNTTLNDASTTIEITVFECGELIEREIWFLVPIHCENGDTLFSANLLPFDYTPVSCGEEVFIPGRSTNNGIFVLANFPRCGGHGIPVAGVGGFPRVGFLNGSR